MPLHAAAMPAIAGGRGTVRAADSSLCSDRPSGLTLPQPPVCPPALAPPRGVYLTKQVSFRNRVLILFDWIKAQVFGRDLSNF